MPAYDYFKLSLNLILFIFFLGSNTLEIHSNFIVRCLCSNSKCYQIQSHLILIYHRRNQLIWKHFDVFHSTCIRNKTINLVCYLFWNSFRIFKIMLFRLFFKFLFTFSTCLLIKPTDFPLIFWNGGKQYLEQRR